MNFKYDIEVANAGFGQGILTTPIQHLQALTIISNNGKMLKPHIVEKIENSDTGETTYERQIEESEKLVSDQTLSKIKELMYNVVNGQNEGTTGTRYKIDGLDVIGKTGTAQIYDDKNGGYLTAENAYIYSFAGMFPKDEPQIIIYAAIKKPNFGNTITISEPVVDVMKNIAKYKNINTTKKEENKDIKQYTLDNYMNKNKDEVVNNLKEQKINTVVIGDGNTIIDYYPKDKIVSNDRIILITNGQNKVIPNMTNWSKREAKFLLDYLGIKYTLNGNGYVKTQTVKEHTPITPELEITLTLENKIKK